ncbi:uncharacterized protein MICPUCDRAFT_60445 [Micromonas pusilla CCMP1545]|uniref:Predicted protein n=1 Tax=Micromonas pusilla (strain CCMP1545) TaxID=564608 RepID=C1MYH4_MICPC|nr:uncharacterized protein MICPUCDRAFT_60445 [Micromonas pusilla CCMP1545]EEH55297.1 predicted protein [Micromonas pusilla CCMP1545]|eukprot:XP_003060528.1 predicted protein [Micromonas pusilla CCMP1545]
MQYQMTLYYRYGELDSCSGRWEAVMACMDKDKRKGESLSAKAPVDLGRAKSKPYWDLMTREEAGKRWRAAFGDAPGAVPSEQEAKRRAAKAAAKAAADVEGTEKR